MLNLQNGRLEGISPVLPIREKKGKVGRVENSAAFLPSNLPTKQMKFNEGW